MTDLVVVTVAKPSSTIEDIVKLPPLTGEPGIGYVKPLPAKTTRVVTYRGIATFRAENGAPPMPGPQRFVAHFGYAEDWTPTWSDLWVGSVKRWTIECTSPWVCDRLGRGATLLASAAFVSADDEAVISVNSPSHFGGHNPLKKPFRYSLTTGDAGLAEICFVHPPTGGVYRSTSGTVVSFSVTTDPEPASHGLMLKGLCALRTALHSIASVPVTD